MEENTRLFEEFVDIVEKATNHDAEVVALVWKRFKRTEQSFISSSVFHNTLYAARSKMLSDSENRYVHLKNFLSDLKSFQIKKGKKRPNDSDTDSIPDVKRPKLDLAPSTSTSENDKEKHESSFRGSDNDTSIENSFKSEDKDTSLHTPKGKTRNSHEGIETMDVRDDSNSDVKSIGVKDIGDKPHLHSAQKHTSHKDNDDLSLEPTQKHPKQVQKEMNSDVKGASRRVDAETLEEGAAIPEWPGNQGVIIIEDKTDDVMEKVTEVSVSSEKDVDTITPEMLAIQNEWVDPGEKKKASKRQLKRLERFLEKCSREIQKLEERELDLGELGKDDSHYTLCDRYKQKFIKVWNKYCKLVGCSPETGRPTQKRFRFEGSRYPEINKKIERFISRNHTFPDYQELRHIIHQCNIKYKLRLSNRVFNELSRDVFTQVGNQLQQRRLADFHNDLGGHLTENMKTYSDPALYDRELQAKLEANKKQFKSKMDEVLTKYSILQETHGERSGEEEDEEDEDEEEEVKIKGESDEEHELTLEETPTKPAATANLESSVPNENDGSESDSKENDAAEVPDLAVTSKEDTESDLENPFCVIDFDINKEDGIVSKEVVDTPESGGAVAPAGSVESANQLKLVIAELHQAKKFNISNTSEKHREDPVELPSSLAEQVKPVDSHNTEEKGLSVIVCSPSKPEYEPTEDRAEVTEIPETDILEKKRMTGSGSKQEENSIVIDLDADETSSEKDEDFEDVSKDMVIDTENISSSNKTKEVEHYDLTKADTAEDDDDAIENNQCDESPEEDAAKKSGYESKPQKDEHKPRTDEQGSASSVEGTSETTKFVIIPLSPDPLLYFSETLSLKATGKDAEDKEAGEAEDMEEDASHGHDQPDSGSNENECSPETPMTEVIHIESPPREDEMTRSGFSDATMATEGGSSQSKVVDMIDGAEVIQLEDSMSVGGADSPPSLASLENPTKDTQESLKSGTGKEEAPKETGPEASFKNTARSDFSDVTMVTQGESKVVEMIEGAEVIRLEDSSSGGEGHVPSGSSEHPTKDTQESFKASTAEVEPPKETAAEASIKKKCARIPAGVEIIQLEDLQSESSTSKEVHVHDRSVPSASEHSTKDTEESLKSGTGKEEAPKETSIKKTARSGFSEVTMVTEGGSSQSKVVDMIDGAEVIQLDMSVDGDSSPPSLASLEHPTKDSQESFKASTAEVEPPKETAAEATIKKKCARIPAGVEIIQLEDLQSESSTSKEVHVHDRSVPSASEHSTKDTEESLKSGTGKEEAPKETGRETSIKNTARSGFSEVTMVTEGGSSQSKVVDMIDGAEVIQLDMSVDGDSSPSLASLEHPTKDTQESFKASTAEVEPPKETAAEASIKKKCARIPAGVEIIQLEDLQSESLMSKEVHVHDRSVPSASEHSTKDTEESLKSGTGKEEAPRETSIKKTARSGFSEVTMVTEGGSSQSKVVDMIDGAEVIQLDMSVDGDSSPPSLASLEHPTKDTQESLKASTAEVEPPKETAPEASIKKKCAKIPATVEIIEVEDSQSECPRSIDRWNKGPPSMSSVRNNSVSVGSVGSSRKAGSVKQSSGHISGTPLNHDSLAHSGTPFPSNEDLPRRLSRHSKAQTAPKQRDSNFSIADIPMLAAAAARAAIPAGQATVTKRSRRMARSGNLSSSRQRDRVVVEISDGEEKGTGRRSSERRPKSACAAASYWSGLPPLGQILHATDSSKQRGEIPQATAVAKHRGQIPQATAGTKYRGQMPQTSALPKHRGQIPQTATVRKHWDQIPHTAAAAVNNSRGQGNPTAAAAAPHKFSQVPQKTFASAPRPRLSEVHITSLSVVKLDNKKAEVNGTFKVRPLPTRVKDHVRSYLDKATKRYGPPHTPPSNKQGVPKSPDGLKIVSYQSLSTGAVIKPGQSPKSQKKKASKPSSRTDYVVLSDDE